MAVDPNVTATPAPRPIALVAAGILVVVTVAGVMVLGVQRPPTVAEVEDLPEPIPSGSVAWTAYEGGRTCVRVARPDGTVDEPWCDQAGGQLEGWTPDGHLVVRHWAQPVERRLLIDPDSGAVVVEQGAPAPDPDAFQGWDASQLTSFRQDGVLVVEADEGRLLWRVAAPEGYRLRSSATSPDGSWVVAVDTAGRLLLFDLDGTAPPRRWASDVEVWDAPIWEGSSGQERQTG